MVHLVQSCSTSRTNQHWYQNVWKCVYCHYPHVNKKLYWAHVLFGAFAKNQLIKENTGSLRMGVRETGPLIGIHISCVSICVLYQWKTAICNFLWNQESLQYVRRATWVCKRSKCAKPKSPMSIESDWPWFKEVHLVQPCPPLSPPPLQSSTDHNWYQ